MFPSMFSANRVERNRRDLLNALCENDAYPRYYALCQITYGTYSGQPLSDNLPKYGDASEKNYYYLALNTMANCAPELFVKKMEQVYQGALYDTAQSILDQSISDMKVHTDSLLYASEKTGTLLENISFAFIYALIARQFAKKLDEDLIAGNPSMGDTIIKVKSALKSIMQNLDRLYITLLYRNEQVPIDNSTRERRDIKQKIKTDLQELEKDYNELEKKLPPTQEMGPTPVEVGKEAWGVTHEVKPLAPVLP